MLPAFPEQENLLDQKRCGISTPYFSLIFVNYHSAAALKRALHSFLEREPRARETEVVVVNNDAQEAGALRTLQELFGFALLENSTNRGFGAAANQGGRQARGEIFGFLNPDILWRTSVFEEAQKIFEERPAVGILGLGLVTPAGRPEPWSGGKEVTLWELLKNNLWRSRFSVRRPREALVARDWVSGGALFIRRGLFKQLGGFDEKFFLYFEDVDLCRRAREQGAQVFWAPFLSLTHYGGQSHLSRQEQKRAFYRSQDQYLKKYATRPAYVCFRVLRRLRYGF